MISEFARRRCGRWLILGMEPASLISAVAMVLFRFLY